jgi:Protein of unknown function (DUF707).
MKNLVISTVGDQSLHKLWIKSEAYDTCLVYYGDKEGYPEESTFYKKAKGYKYHLIKDLLDESPHFFEYDYIWLPDDDVAARPSDIIKLFSMMKEYQLEISQPSIMGYYGVEVNLHKTGSILRYTNWVEIMCPCFSSAALKICKESFKENNCGWSIEGIWNVLLGHPRDKIAIIDDVIVCHTRPVLTGDTYTNLTNPLEFALKEANDVCSRWELGKHAQSDLSYGKPISTEVYCAVQYGQVRKVVGKNIPKDKRCWPDSEIFTDMITSLKYRE